MRGRLRLATDCNLCRIDGWLNIRSFSCGDDDLDEFFHREAILYDKQLLGRSYCYVLSDKPDVIVAAFTLANDSVKAALMTNATRNKIQRNIPNSKRTRSYPALLIGRLGVAKEFQNFSNVGGQVIDHIISWFVEPNNKSGCRFLIVDAYNKPRVLHFYSKNGFKYLYPTEEVEKEANQIPSKEFLRSRMMYLDLINFAYQSPNPD